MQNPLIISVTGYAESGKDTSANYIEAKLQAIGLKVVKYALADRLKLIGQRLIKLFYGIDVPIEEFHRLDDKKRIRHDYPLFAGAPFSLRSVMQQVGSEVFRDLLWRDIWCDYVQKQCINGRQPDVLIISDCRFQNEIDYFSRLITNATYLTLRINRPNHEQLPSMNRDHQSESEIAKLDVMYDVINDSDLSALYQKLDDIINPLLAC